MSVIAKSVEVLRCPVGNLWDIYVDDLFMVRVTYHGNNLHILKNIPRGSAKPATTSEIEAAINNIYI